MNIIYKMYMLDIRYVKNIICIVFNEKKMYMWLHDWYMHQLGPTLLGQKGHQCSHDSHWPKKIVKKFKRLIN